MFQLDNPLESGLYPPYTTHHVVLDKTYTLEEFIHTVLSRKDEWGQINVIYDRNGWREYPGLNYRFGTIVKTFRSFPKNTSELKVKSVTARGRRGLMDYFVVLEKEA